MSARILHGDCLDVLRGVEAASVDAIVTDPPYDLTSGKRGGTGAASLNLDSPAGRSRIGTGGGFMGKAWDATGIAFRPETWREALRVLKPGGHALIFGGDRTHHRMMCAVEDAGFEIRHTIVWLTGQSFPKSLDVGKAIDRAAGAERKVVGLTGTRRPRSTVADAGVHYGRRDDGGEVSDFKPATAPATDAARRWDGWGTSLKTSAEYICLARKPLSEANVAANVLRHGTGALNIAATRIGLTGGGTNCSDAPGPCRGHANGIYSPTVHNNGRDGEASADRRYAEAGGTDFAATPGPRGGDARGRWPANAVFSHIPPDENGKGGCERVGTRRVRSGVSGTGGGFRTALVGGELKDTELAGRAWGTYNDADGMEEVDDWRCVEGCAVRLLDAQSGERGDHGALLRGDRPTEASGAGIFGGGRKSDGNVYSDTGGASRFFYCAKADTSERAFLCHTCDGRVYPSTERDRHRKHERVEHPTVKPVDLLRWLHRLVCPPGGMICDPFAGSGTGGVAALRDGFHWIGIESDANYCQIARMRIEADAPLFLRVREETRP